MMPPGSSIACSPWVASTAANASVHGWFLISAVTSPFTSLPRMMVRPEKAAKPATTSEMSALSQVTVIRGSATLPAGRTGSVAGWVTSGAVDAR